MTAQQVAKLHLDDEDSPAEYLREEPLRNSVRNTPLNFAASMILIDVSHAPANRCEPSGFHTREVTRFGSSVKQAVAKQFSVQFQMHSGSLELLVASATMRPAEHVGSTATEVMGSSARKMLRHAPELRSQMRTVASSEPDARIS